MWKYSQAPRVNSARVFMPFADLQSATHATECSEPHSGSAHVRSCHVGLELAWIADIASGQVVAGIDALWLCAASKIGASWASDGCAADISGALPNHLSKVTSAGLVARTVPVVARVLIEPALHTLLGRTKVAATIGSQILTHLLAIEHHVPIELIPIALTRMAHYALFALLLMVEPILGQLRQCWIPTQWGSA